MGDLPPPPATVFDVDKEREGMRGHLAMGLLLVFTAVIAAGFITLWVDAHIYTETKDMFAVALSAVTGLLGSATGFYFGSAAYKHKAD